MTAIDPQRFQIAAELQADMGPRAAAGGDAVALFALGFAPADFVPFAREIAAETPVLLADGYGILPHQTGKNVHHPGVDNEHIRRFIACGHVDTVFHGGLRP